MSPRLRMFSHLCAQGYLSSCACVRTALPITLLHACCTSLHCHAPDVLLVQTNLFAISSLTTSAQLVFFPILLFFLTFHPSSPLPSFFRNQLLILPPTASPNLPASIFQFFSFHRLSSYFSRQHGQTIRIHIPQSIETPQPSAAINAATFISYPDIRNMDRHGKLCHHHRHDWGGNETV